MTVEPQSSPYLRAPPRLSRSAPPGVGAQRDDDWRWLRRRKREDRPPLASSPRPFELPDAPWPADRPVDHESPGNSPVRPQGSILLIAHLLWPTFEEPVRALAIRWTKTHVMVLVRPAGGPPDDELVVWLRTEDVHRTMPRR